MPDIWMDVDTAVTIPVNLVPLVALADGYTIDETIAWNEGGMDLVWNFVETDGTYSCTAVTPTTADDHDWDHQDAGMYTLGFPASGGDANNDTEGFGWFSGKADAILPFRGPTVGFRAAGLNNLLIDSAYSATRGLTGTALPAAAADAAGGLPISDAGGLDLDVILAGTVLLSTTIGSNNRGKTTCELSAGSDNNDAYIGMKVILDDDAGDGEYVSRTITDYVGASLTVTWTPAITEDAEDGGNIYIVPGDTKINVTADAVLVDTNELQADWTNTGRLDTILDAILSMLDDARGEPAQGNPPVNPDAMTKLDYLYKQWRNKKDNDGSTRNLYADDASTVDQKSSVAEAGGTVTVGEVATGP